MLIALSAKKRHGKDTLADYIVDKYKFSKYALASPFKELLCKEFEFTNDQINGYGFDREKYLGVLGKTVVNRFKNVLNKLGYYASVYNIDWSFIENDDLWSIRKLMQTIGTDIGCNLVDKLIWMHPMVERYNNGENLIISDCRQDHEMQLMRNFNALVIHIINPNIIDNDSHITEAGLPILDGDIVIRNNFDPNNKSYQYKVFCLNALYNQVDGAISEFIKKTT